MYDYNPGNNTATITAVRGTGGVGGGAPRNPRTQTGTTTVMWDDVEFLHGLPVARYEVQWLGSDWTMLGDAVIENQYVDAAPSGRRDYRVRAVNLAGVAGPWSRSTVTVQAGHAGPPVNLRTQADGNNAIDVSWDAPEDVGGSAITGYTVQWSLDGTEGSWNHAGSTVGPDLQAPGAANRGRAVLPGGGAQQQRPGPVVGPGNGSDGVRRARRAHPAGHDALRLRYRVDVERAQGQRTAHHRLPVGTVPRRLRR